MKQNVLFVLWGLLFSLCAGLGFIPEPEGPVKLLLTALALVCFLPPALLLYRAKKEHNRHTLALIRNLSAMSLGLTAVLLVLNVLSVRGSEALGRILHILLVILSSPMISSGYWALSLFFWACLLITAGKLLKSDSANL